MNSGASPLWEQTAPSSETAAQPAPRSILVVKPSSLGDIVHALPAVALVKRHWPEARLQWLINSEWAPLLEDNPYVDEVIDFPRRAFRGLAASVAAARWAANLSGRVSADLVLDFQGLLRSAVIAKIGCATGGQIAGLSDSREGARLFYNRIADVSKKHHAVDRCLGLVSMLGIPVSESLDWPLPQGHPPSAELPPRFVLLHPFARGRGKSLSPEDVRAFCAALAPHPVVIAGVGDQAILPTDNAVDLLNHTTLLELIWLLRKADYVVSVDSGPMHIAAALTNRLVSIHTWSDPRRVGPYRRDAWIWRNGSLSPTSDLGHPAEALSIPTVPAIAEWLAKLITFNSEN